MSEDDHPSREQPPLITDKLGYRFSRCGITDVTCEIGFVLAKSKKTSMKPSRLFVSLFRYN